MIANWCHVPLWMTWTFPLEFKNTIVSPSEWMAMQWRPIILQGDVNNVTSFPIIVVVIVLFSHVSWIEWWTGMVADGSNALYCKNCCGFNGAFIVSVSSFFSVSIGSSILVAMVRCSSIFHHLSNNNQFTACTKIFKSLMSSWRLFASLESW